MYAVKGIFDGERVMTIDPIPVEITPESFSAEERMSALENLIGIAHSENPNFAEKLAKEERLARQ